MAYPKLETVEVLDLSRAVREWEAPEPEPDAPVYKVNLYTGNDYDGGWECAHPLVVELVQSHEDGPAAALAYMAEGSEADAPALVRWMVDAYKGHFGSEGLFARDQFGDAFADHIEGWDKREGIGFPLDLDMVEFVDWDRIGDELADGDTWYFVPDTGGVYVFDISIDINEYREED